MPHWIWLDKRKYPEYQKTFPCAFVEDKQGFHYGVAEFCKHIELVKESVSIHIRVSGDTFFRLWLNGSLVGVGPVAAGGDFLCLEPMPKQYANNYTLAVSGRSLHFIAEVQLSPVVMTDYSCGHGGFFLIATVQYSDGTTEMFTTDETWQARLNRAFSSPGIFDGRIPPDDWTSAEMTEDIWNLTDAPVPMLFEQEILPVEGNEALIQPGETIEYPVLFDRIYSGYVNLDISGFCDITADCFEFPSQSKSTERVIAIQNMQYRSIRMHSIGGYTLTISNHGQNNAIVKPSLIFTCYPVTQEGEFVSDDLTLNKVYDVCKWTLRICRQTLHLDSPLHQEPLACTGDYFIETLMTAFTFGDMRLAALDVVRTADWLQKNKGVMFHTSYSLIWVQMLDAVYQFTGDLSLVRKTSDALKILLDRFHTYLGDNGVLEHAPNYMFVDWVVSEGYSMHHPPKALGQTCLNAFYYKALTTAVLLFKEIDDPECSNLYCLRAQSLRYNFNHCFYDAKKKLYFDGLPTPNDPNRWLPQNINIRHFSRYGNTLAVLYDLCKDEDAGQIMEQVVNNETWQQVQPYFMHFILEAVNHTGLFHIYGMQILRMWGGIVEECDKGLKEGWIVPQEDYIFDHSHAWGGTPAYQLPARLLGFKMLEPGYKKISLSPNLHDLKYAKLSIPTPYGYIRCHLHHAAPPIVIVPSEIECDILYSKA